MVQKSILKPILLQLRILKFFGGFPLKVYSEEDATQFHFQCVQGIKLIFYFVVFNLCFVSIILYNAFVIATTDLVIFSTYIV
jgi:hypothetical protein